MQANLLFFLKGSFFVVLLLTASVIDIRKRIIPDTICILIAITGLVDIFHPLDIKVIDHIVVAGTRYSSMAEKGELPHLSINKANYEVIALDEMVVEENQDSFQYTQAF